MAGEVGNVLEQTLFFFMDCSIRIWPQYVNIRYSPFKEYLSLLTLVYTYCFTMFELILSEESECMANFFLKRMGPQTVKSKLKPKLRQL